MDTKMFKVAWNLHEMERWAEFSQVELNKSPLKERTKLFLKNGFPEDAAPFLNFGWKSYKDKFFNVYSYYSLYDVELEEDTKHYWILGSDGGGNPICFDVLNNDRLVLLDHEIGFEIMYQINSSIMEFAECLLAYRKFVKQVQKKFGQSAYIKSNYTIEFVEQLKNNFSKINSHLFDENYFWKSAVGNLESRIN